MKPTAVDLVAIPAAQSTVSAVLVGATVGSLAWLAGWDAPGAWGMVAGSLTGVMAWFGYGAAWQRRMDAIAGILEQVQTDRINAATVRVEVISDDARAGDYLQLPGDRDKLQVLAVGLTAGKPLTVRTWTGPGGVYSPTEFEQLRAELIARGLARWRSPHDPRAGAELSRKGAAVMRGLADRSPACPAGQSIFKIARQ
jgi:hypothetical protein